jgi:hypothetical protein
MGGEDRRPDGGAVSFLAGGYSWPRAGLVLVLTMSFALMVCSQQNAAAPPDATTLLQAIAVADPAKYPTLQEAKRWGNPYLVIRPDSVGLLSSVAANEEQILKPEEVLNALARLPASAWPYGRAVAILVDEKAAASEPDKIAVRRNRGIVAGDLESAHVTIQWIPPHLDTGSQRKNIPTQ